MKAYRIPIILAVSLPFGGGAMTQSAARHAWPEPASETIPLTTRLRRGAGLAHHRTLLRQRKR